MNEILEYIKDIDAQLLLAINGAHIPFFDGFMYLYTGVWIWVPLYLVTIWVLFRSRPARDAVMAIVLIGLIIFLTERIAGGLIRPALERMRPTNLANPLSEFVHVVDGYRAGRYGFPSLHAANTFALTVYVAMMFRRRAITLTFLGWALLNCYSRSYLGVHYPGDLLCGALFGMAFSWLMCWLALRKWLFPRLRYRAYDKWLPLVVWLLSIVACVGYGIWYAWPG